LPFALEGSSKSFYVPSFFRNRSWPANPPRVEAKQLMNLVPLIQIVQNFQEQ
jgi:hypothetical protein